MTPYALGQEVKFDKEQIEGSIVLGKITDANEKQLFATAI